MFSPALNELLNQATNLVLDSRSIKPGDLFIAYKGAAFDGRDFIDDAIAKGASAVLAEGEERVEYRGKTPVFFTPHIVSAIGLIAAKFYHHPSNALKVIGITGTNGKTSCAHFIASALHELNLVCGVIGTLGNGLYGHLQATNLTTPDAITLQKTLAGFLKQEAKYVAMEVSSHSLDQGRINGINFFVSIYTNLTRDHLDYHGSMENYGNAKKKLFESTATHCSVMNADDEWGLSMLHELQNKGHIYAYGTTPAKLPAHIPYVEAKNVQLDLEGIRAEIHSPWGVGELRAGIMGKFNVSNLLAVFTTLCLLGIPFKKALQAIAQLKSVDGRMQFLGGNEKPLVVVDYSHTPDALEKALMALRHHCAGKLYCIFGCGGDRDRGKRPIMAGIAEQLSDYVVLTDDNPRTESAEQIFADIKAGFSKPAQVVIQHDRAEAIQYAIKQAKKGDCILIAGKGAETYQIIGTEKFPFSDVEQVILALK